MPSQLLDHDGTLEWLHLLRQSARQFVVVDRPAHLRQSVTQEPEHEAVGDVAQLAHVAGPRIGHQLGQLGAAHERRGALVAAAPPSA